MVGGRERKGQHFDKKSAIKRGGLGEGVKSLKITWIFYEYTLTYLFALLTIFF